MEQQQLCGRPHINVLCLIKHIALKVELISLSTGNTTFEICITCIFVYFVRDSEYTERTHTDIENMQTIHMDAGPKFKLAPFCHANVNICKLSMFHLLQSSLNSNMEKEILQMSFQLSCILSKKTKNKIKK